MSPDIPVGSDLVVPLSNVRSNRFLLENEIPPDLTIGKTSDPVQALEILFALRFDGGKRHIGANNSFRNCQGVVEVVLVGLRERFHILGRNQFHLMPHRLELSRPIAGTSACLHSDLARRKPHHNLLGFPSLDHPAINLFPFFVASDQAKHSFCQVDAEYANLLVLPPLFPLMMVG